MDAAFRNLIVVFGLAAGGFLAGCAGSPVGAESAARRQAAGVGRVYRPADRPPVLPALAADSPAADYLRFALLRHPRVEAGFYAWRGAIEAIAPARSLPDPQLTFQADIGRTVMSLMPGLMFEFMGAGKRAAMGREAAAASEVARREYAATIADTVVEVRTAWVELSFADEALAIRREAAATLDQSLAIAQADYATGSGMGSLETQTRLLDARARLQAELATLSDRRASARTRFKSALGLRFEEADPPWPSSPFPSAPAPDPEAWWRQMLAANPQLASMRAMVEMAVASVDVARRAGTPDFSAGLMAEVKADPAFVRPLATVSLPLWRDKVAAVLASAQARRLAAEARLGAEELAMADELARMILMLREADRMSEYIDRSALPNLARTRASAEAAYQSGAGGFATLAELRLMGLDLRLERAAARRDRETALAGLSRLVAGGAPADLLPAPPSPSS